MKSLLRACTFAGILAVVPAAADDRPAADTGTQDADNTGKNVRDRDDKTLTPMDQGGSASDRELTAAIRRAIVDDDSLSTNAQNVKIVTVDGVVTLRGPVKNTAERAAVASMAAKANGVKRVENQLEVEGK
jgi:osmotically-inducible protein OsmY